MTSLHLTLPRTAASPAHARQEASRFAADLDTSSDPSGTDLALLVLSELVTNAVLYGADPIQVSVTCTGGALRIEVSDGDADTSKVVAVDAPDAPDAPARGGRGLQIVSRLAREWGVAVRDGGKTVWAEVVLDRPQDGD
jgi:anti-sigma regulatory factor (Ser/Thr protein kinase)